MLEEFITEQPLAYRLIRNSIIKKKISHAYLFEANGYSRSLDIAIAFAKYLLCFNHYENKNNCGNCSICEKIDNNSFSELMIIEPDGMWIKKEQIDKLQEEFSKKAIEASKRIYIINKAEKMNSKAANSILKFLEEPEENIIAILTTDNIHQLLDTIVSRCQIISLNKNKEINRNVTTLERIANTIFNRKTLIEAFVNDNNSEFKIKKIIEFIKFLENNKIDTLLHINKLWHDFFNSKEDIMNAFDIIILFYKDLMNLKLNKKIEIFVDYQDDLEKILKLNTINSICDKIKLVLKLKDNINVNVNNNLLMDKLVIMLGEI
ncbi:MAG: hypothetical protein GX247_01515 [Mollicutes bacterium]|nr:hypothetical protein [Mollicutes bacterium]